MGNCGFSLAPATVEQRPLVVRNLERAEDISGPAMEEGIEWRWSDFRSYLDVVDTLPKGINYAAYVGHSALRTWVMGERAFEERASDEDLATMSDELRSGLRAGAIGLSTSRSTSHLTSDGRPVASRTADWREVAHLVGTMGELGTGLLGLAHEPAIRSADLDEPYEYHLRLRELAVRTRVPVTFGLIDKGGDPSHWRDQLALIEETTAMGGRMHAQAHSRDIAVLLSFESTLPFDRLPEWRSFRSSTIEEQAVRLRDPAIREALVRAARDGRYATTVGAEARPPDYSEIRVLRSATRRGPTVEEEAAAAGMDPVDHMIEVAVAADLWIFFTQTLDNDDLGHVEEILRHPASIMTFSDSGAHVSQIIDSSVHTHLLAEWVRARGALTL